MTPSPSMGEGRGEGDLAHPSERRHLRGAVDRARRLRRDMTEAELRLWYRLREQEWGFRRQVPIGRYIADFVHHPARLIVELDGGQHNEAAAQAYDDERTVWLAAQGYSVLRFWNSEVMENMEGVLETILRAVSPSPRPSPIKGEGAALRSPATATIPGAAPSPSMGEGWGEGETMPSDGLAHAALPSFQKAP